MKVLMRNNNPSIFSPKTIISMCKFNLKFEISEIYKSPKSLCAVNPKCLNKLFLWNLLTCAFTTP
jgi:hypothetical protein